MLYREIIAVCSQIHTKHINTLCGQNVELLNVKLAAHNNKKALKGQFVATPPYSLCRWKRDGRCAWRCFPWDCERLTVRVALRQVTATAQVTLCHTECQ